MKRRLAIVCLLVLSVSAGCMTPSDVGSNLDLGLGLGEQADQNTTYDWNTSANATLTLESNQYHSVYELEKKQLKLYTHGIFGSERSLNVRAVKYRYPNGTIITTDNSDLSVDKSNDQTVLKAPSGDGKIAFTTDKRPKTLSMPVFLETKNPSYEIILPQNMSVDIPVVSSVKPGGYETTTEDGRVHIVWKSLEANSIAIRYYLTRDLYIFGAVLGLGLIGGLIGVGYYLFQIRRLKRLRKQIEIEGDIDTGNDH